MDLFSKDLILIPVHLGVHWVLVTMDMKKKELTYFDSLHTSNPTCLRILSEYLRAEHQDKKNSPLVMEDWEMECPKNIPSQANGYDCGVFTCVNAERKSRDAPLDYSQKDMLYFRRRISYEIITGSLF